MIKMKTSHVRMSLFIIIWSGTPISMIHMLGGSEVKQTIGLHNCAKVAVNENDVKCVTWNC